MEHVLDLYKNKPEDYESEQSFQPRQRPEDWRTRHDFREDDANSSSNDDCVKIMSPVTKCKTLLCRKRKPGIEAQPAAWKSWKKQSTTPVVIGISSASDMPPQPEKAVHTCSLLLTTSTEAPTEKAVEADDPLVELPLEGWDPQQFEVVAKLIQNDQQEATGTVSLMPVTMRTELQELAMLYLQPTQFEHIAPPAHQPTCRGASLTSGLLVRNRGTTTAMAICASAATDLPQDPQNLSQQLTNEDFLRETDLLLTRGEEILGNLAHQHLPPLRLGAMPEYVQTCPLDLSLPNLMSGIPNDCQNNNVLTLLSVYSTSENSFKSKQSHCES